jgi:hypothetical protein
MKKLITLCLIIVTLSADSGMENKAINIIITKLNGDLITKLPLSDTNLNFQGQDLHSTALKEFSCINKLSKIKEKRFLQMNSVKILCKGSTDQRSTKCNLKIFNVDNNRKRENEFLSKKICVNYSPKQIVDEYDFKLVINSKNTLILDNKYKLEYFLYKF